MRLWLFLRTFLTGLRRDSILKADWVWQVAAGKLAGWRHPALAMQPDLIHGRRKAKAMLQFLMLLHHLGKSGDCRFKLVYHSAKTPLQPFEAWPKTPPRLRRVRPGSERTYSCHAPTFFGSLASSHPQVDQNCPFFRIDLFSAQTLNFLYIYALFSYLPFYTAELLEGADRVELHAKSLWQCCTSYSETGSFAVQHPL